MQQVCLRDGFDGNFFFNPIRAWLGKALLLEAIAKGQFFILDLKCLLIDPV
jgi:hypothetical protein